MPKFVIEREIPGVGRLPAESMRTIAQKSCSVLQKMGPSIQWVESFVTEDKLYCVYIAPDEAAVREHASQGGFPANRILRVPFVRTLERPGGIVSGMTLMGAADVAMWLAIMTLRGIAEHWVTADMKTAFLRSAREEDIACDARILKPGRRSMYGAAECRGADSRLIAHHVITYARVEA